MLPDSKPLNISSPLRCYQTPAFISREDLNKTKHSFTKMTKCFQWSRTYFLVDRSRLPPRNPELTISARIFSFGPQADYCLLSHLVQYLTIIKISRKMSIHNCLTSTQRIVGWVRRGDNSSLDLGLTLLLHALGSLFLRTIGK